MDIRTVEVEIEGISPLSMNKFHGLEKLKSETDEAFQKRIFKERLHKNSKGMLYIPQEMIKYCIMDTAQYLGMKVGKTNYTYGKKFKAACQVMNPVDLGINEKDVDEEWTNVPSAKAGGGRIKKLDPIIRKWGGAITFLILDEVITEDVFEQHINAAGMIIGIGCRRPINGGQYGRFKVKKIKWK